MSADDEQKADITSLQAEVTALNAVLGYLIRRLERSGSIPRSVLEQVFEDAANAATVVAMRTGTTVPAELTGGTLKIIEELRAASLNSHD